MVLRSLKGCSHRLRHFRILQILSRVCAAWGGFLQGHEWESTLFLPELSLTERFFLNPPWNPCVLRHTAVESVCKGNSKWNFRVCSFEAVDNFDNFEFSSFIKHIKATLFKGKILCKHQVKEKSNGTNIEH